MEDIRRDLATSEKVLKGLPVLLIERGGHGSAVRGGGAWISETGKPAEFQARFRLNQAMHELHAQQKKMNTGGDELR